MDKRVLRTVEFNGGMGYDMSAGQHVVTMLRDIKDSSPDVIEDDFRGFIEDLNNVHFNYPEKLIRDEVISDISFEKDFYFHNWFSDYIYVLNVKKEPVIVSDYHSNKEEIESGEMAAFYFGKKVGEEKLLENVPESLKN